MRISGLLINIAASVCILCAVLPSYAASGGDKGAVVGFVDTDIISKESTASKELHEQFQKKQEELQAIVLAQEESLKSAVKDLDEKRSVLASEALTKMQNDIEASKKALAEAVMKSRSFLEKNYVKDVTAIGEVSKKAMADVAKSEGVKVIVAKAGVLHADEGALESSTKDVTNKVLEKLNKVLPSYKVNFEGTEELPENMRGDSKKAADKKKADKK
jgi:Skp family chaperone for outer membrane proteins